MTKFSLLPEQGERAFIAGQTGSGKTAFAVWVLMRVPMSPVIIYDTKEENKFLVLPNVKLVTALDDLDEAYADQSLDYIVMRPDIDTVANPAALDEILYHHYLNYRGSVCYIDEAYMFHTSGRPGRGLIALYTRGRSRGITTIMATQRPAWISKFAISEAQRYYVFYLELPEDRKSIKPALLNLPEPPKYGFYYWKSGEKIPTRYRGVKLDPGLDKGYVDFEPATSDRQVGTGDTVELDTVASKKRGAVFI